MKYSAIWSNVKNIVVCTWYLSIIWFGEAVTIPSFWCALCKMQLLNMAMNYTLIHWRCIMFLLHINTCNQPANLFCEMMQICLFLKCRHFLLVKWQSHNFIYTVSQLFWKFRAYMNNYLHKYIHFRIFMHYKPFSTYTDFYTESVGQPF